jgi:hypothetical protein
MSLKYINNNGEEVIIAGKGTKGQDGLKGENGEGISVGTVIGFDGDEIPEGYEEIEIINQGEEIYSTNEEKIGTWIDGRPIYRKVMHLPIPATTTDGTLVYKDYVISENIKDVISLRGFAEGDTYKIYYPFWSTTTGHITRAQIGTEQKQLQMLNYAVAMSNKLATIIVDYTKAIDNPELITFSVYGKTYQAEKGMTFKQWVDSPYSLEEWSCPSTTAVVWSETLYTGSGSFTVDIYYPESLGGAKPLGHETIISGLTYSYKLEK